MLRPTGHLRQVQVVPLIDRQSWNDTDTTTRGRCVPFQAECESCTATFNEDNPPVIPGLNAYAFYSTQAALDDRTKPLGTYASRAVQFHADGGQFDFVWLSPRAMHPHVGPQHVWCLAA